MKLKRKSIDLPNGVLKKLEAMAALDRRLVKNYMEKILIDHTKTPNNGMEGNTGVKATSGHSEA